MPSRYPRGSEWRKWDLHVHTPESIVATHYHGNTKEERWENFLVGLEALPEEFKVIGINDYIFLDGYRRVHREKTERGRLANIERIFPVVEMRVDKFGGTESKLRRVNLHVIFSDEIEADLIATQFLPAMMREYSLSPEWQGKVTWNAIPTPDSLRDLGTKIINTVPNEKKPDFGDPLTEGFNALNFSLESIEAALSVHYFRGKALTAVGKTEWWDIKWNEHSVAEKKTIINGADIVFVAAASPEEYARARDSLSASGVNNHLLDCSDAHCSADDENNKDRLGNCFTWVKADPTFEGLKLALREFDDRVFVGDEPPLLARVRANKTKFIKSISFAKDPKAKLPDVWLDGCAVEFNPGLVAIVGNKGSGKSALSDTIGLLGNTPQFSDFSFLSSSKFRSGKTGTMAKCFTAQITWATGTCDPPKNLNDDPVPSTPETVKYIPQDYLERICNEVEGYEEGRFDHELKTVIFSRTEKADRLGQPDMPALIKYTTETAEATRKRLAAEISLLNARIAQSEERLSPKHRSEVEGALAQKNRELASHDSSKPVEPPKPATAGADAVITEQLQKVQEAMAECDKAITGANTALEEATKREAAGLRLSDKLTNISRTAASMIDECRADAVMLGIPVDSLVSVKVDDSLVTAARKLAQKQQRESRSQLDANITGSPAAKRAELDAAVGKLRQQLAEPARLYQAYLSTAKKWTDDRSLIVGSAEVPGSVAWLEAEIAAISSTPKELETLYASRAKKVREIHACIAELSDKYQVMFRGVNEFVQGHALRDKLSIAFRVDIVPIGFVDTFLALISQKPAGTFCGADEGRRQLAKMLEPVDFLSADATLQFVADLTGALIHDRRPQGKGAERRIEDQLSKGTTVATLYDTIYSLSYLQPRPILQWKGSELAVLSPGERGTLLLAFYLLIDGNDIPLVIDQPEGNLDNETVYELLVHCLKDAKRRRQVVIVTHNANLAVVCDADQVVYASIDRNLGNRISYESGAIENSDMNRHIVDVLEGTKPAFDNRNDKYEAVRSS